MQHSLKRIAAGVILLGGLAGAGALAIGADLPGHAMRMHDGAGFAAHADKMLKHLYIELDATDDQKARIDPLVKQALDDLKTLHGQAHGADFITLLAQPAIDRNALEAARQQHLQLADQASKRIVQLVADVGDVLTVAQRQKLAEHLQRLHARRHG
ncbi:MAG: Spy/CpxP family protein refolding chaperone [Pseudomonadota bacterium]